MELRIYAWSYASAVVFKSRKKKNPDTRKYRGHASKHIEQGGSFYILTKKIKKGQ
jgi:hypothetical protein